MIQIDDPTVLDKIIKNLFKKKRNVPRSITIFPECDVIHICWKNGHWTKIKDMFIDISIEMPNKGDTYGIITLSPKRLDVKKQYRFTTFIFDITNFRNGEAID